MRGRRGGDRGQRTGRFRRATGRWGQGLIRIEGRKGRSTRRRIRLGIGGEIERGGRSRQGRRWKVREKRGWRRGRECERGL